MGNWGQFSPFQVQIRKKLLGLVAMALVSFVVTSPSFSQQNLKKVPTNSAPEQFLDSRPDILVVVTQHPLGPDMFTISALDANYPPDALNQAIAAFGKSLNSAPRGLVITVSTVKTASGESQNFLQAAFAVDGFMSANAVKLQDLTRAFSGFPAGKGQVKTLDVSLAGYVANSHTIQSYVGPDPKAPTVEISAQSYQKPAGVEFRINLLSQDASQIVIPDSTDHIQDVLQSKKGGASGIWVLELLVIGLAGIGAAVLVYNFLLRGGSRAKSGSRSVNK